MLDVFARGLAACLILATISPLTLAQPGDPEAFTDIDLPEALAKTLADNPALRAKGLEVTGAEGRLLQSTFRPSPRLNVELENALGTDTYTGVDSSEATISLGWVLERGLREHIVEAARAGIAMSSTEVEIARLDAAAETARRFIECLMFQARYQQGATGVERAREAVEAVRRRVAASRAPAAELARAEAALARAELRLDDYLHELESAYHRLSAQWGVTEPGFTAVAGELNRAPAVDSFAALMARVEQNPDLAALISRARLAEAELNLARARSRPSWEVSGGLRRLERTDDWALVGGITVPLRMGNQNQGRIAETRAAVAQLEAAQEAARVEIETQLFVLYQALIHNIELAAGLSMEVAPRIEAALADTRRAFELGSSSYLEFRAIQTELLEVTFEIIDAHADANLLAIEIERLTGASLSAVPLSERG